MSFFTDAELGALSIKRTILHVVSAKDKFQPQRELTGGEHLEFFLDRIIGSAISSVHRFEENSGIKAIIARMAKDEVSFEKGAQELSRQFSKDHVRSANNGAFFVFELSGGDPNVRLYSLIKYDYRPVIELYADKGRNALRQIVQAFIKEKRAIQKSCLVRAIGGEVDAEVSTFDRMGDAPDLTDYFAAYLDVVRDRDDAELSTRLNEVIRKTLQTCRDLLPNADVPKAVAATKDSLRGRDTVDEDAIR